MRLRGMKHLGGVRRWGMTGLTRIKGNVLSGMPLDRAAHLRTDAAWLAARLDDPSTRFLAIWRQNAVVRLGPEPRAVIHYRETLDGLLDERAEPALLGIEVDDGAPGAAHFVVDFSHVEAEALLARSPGGETDGPARAGADRAGHGCRARRLCARVLPTGTAATASAAFAVHRAEVREAGHHRRCTSEDCGAVHFPRTDTAVITLVHDGDECLLCRQSRWPPGMHSTLAGFLEPGESLEECVAREIEEESGIKVGDVRYHSSQPWPFPGTLMVGFMAQALSREIAVDETELEYAHWYRRRDLLGCRDSDAFRLPGRYSISRRLIEDWLAGRIPP